MLGIDYAHGVFIALSLASTIPTITGGVGVLFLFREAARDAARTPAAERNEMQWLLLGIAVSFRGSLIDNTYWGLAWLAAYLSHPAEGFLFAFGVVPNLFARQGATAYAAYCHIKAAGDNATTPMKLAVSIPWMISAALGIVLITLI